MRRYLLLIPLFFLLYATAQATWSYTQTFNALTNGELHAQDSWSGGTNYTVTAAAVMEGAKYVNMTATGEEDIFRNVTASAAGSMSIMMRKGSAASLIWDVRLNNGATIGAFVRFKPDGNIYLMSSSDVLIQAYSANTNYVVEIEYDAATDQQRARIDGGTFTAWSALFSSATVSTFDRIYMSKQDGGTSGVAFDDIKNTAAAPAAASFDDTYFEVID